MTWEEAVQSLVDAGWDRKEAEEAITTLQAPVPGTEIGITLDPDLSGSAGPVTEQIDPAAVQLFVAQGPGGAPSETFSPEAPPGFVPPEPQTEDQAQIGVAQGALAQLADPEGGPLTSAQEESIEDLGEDTVAQLVDLIREQALLDATAPNYDWVHGIVDVGSLDSNEALISIYELLASRGQAEQGLTVEEEVVAEAKSVLSRGSQNESVILTVVTWGDQAGHYTSTRETDGVLDTDILEMMQRYSLSEPIATDIGRVANRTDLNVLDFAEVWDNFGFKEGQTIAVTPEEQLGGDLRDFRFVQRGIFDVAQLYKKGLGLYDQSHLMASVFIGDPALAQRLRSDPYSLDSGELQRALDSVGGAEGDTSNPQINWIRQRLAGGFRPSEDIDKEAMRNAVQVLADGWNLIGTEGVVANLTAELVSQAVARGQASLPNPFGPLPEGVSLNDTIQDQAAHVKRRLRETPEYKDLFKHLAGGESEEEFVRRFEIRSQEVLGDDVVSAVRNAQRTGNVNTIFQQGLNTPVGESSTRFQEILARNAQTFRDVL